jgi:hypothetical protein
MQLSVPFCMALAIAATGPSAVAAAPQPSKSTPAAKALAGEMARQHLSAVAAKDPDHPGFYIGASLVPGVQLLVVSARSQAPAYLDEVVAAKRYDEAYASINGASFPDGKLFVQDLHADGLLPNRDGGGSFDIVYKDVVKTFMFNGESKKQHMSDAQYRDAFNDLDVRYASLLSMLLAQLTSGS